MTSSKREYFEQAEVWDNAYRHNAVEAQRIQETIAALPADAKSILDAGCGNGTFLNTLVASGGNAFTRMAGLDRSREALKQVQCEAHEGSVAQMPFEDASFDVVTCLEVLEHLTEPELAAALSELQRVSRKYILLTVPNREDLIQSLVICPQCACCFSPWGHLRSFAREDLDRLFRHFDPHTVKTIGPESEALQYHPIVRGAHLLWKRPALPAYCICPQCQHRATPREAAPARPSSARRGLRPALSKVARGLLGSKSQKKKWLFALYVKRENV